MPTELVLKSPTVRGTAKLFETSLPFACAKAIEQQAARASNRAYQENQ